MKEHEVFKSPAFQFYPKDWLSDMRVQAMTAEQRGVFITLLAVDWNEGGLPDDLELLVGVCKADQSVVESIMQRMFNVRLTVVERVTNGRLNKEREAQNAKRAQQSAAGRKSAEARQRQRVRESNDRLTPVERTSNSSTAIASNSKPPSHSSNALSPKGEIKESDQELLDKAAKNERKQAQDQSEEKKRDLTAEKKKTSSDRKPKAKKKFTIPTIAQIAQVMLSVKAEPRVSFSEAQAQAERCFNYYESNGWRVGKNPMKSFEGVARNWIKNQRERKYEGNRKIGGTRNNGTFNTGQAAAYGVLDE